MKRAAYSPRRTAFIARNTLQAAVRQRVFHVLALFALIVVLGAQHLRDFHFGSPELKFLADLGLGAIAASGTVLAVVLTAQAFFSEIEHRTVQTLLAKPVGRGEFVLGKFLGVAVILGAFCGILALVLAAVLWTRERALLRELPEALGSGRLINYAYLAGCMLLEWMKLLVLASLTLLVACYARTQLFAIATGFMMFVICHLQYLAQSASSRPGPTFAGTVASLAARIFPDFQLFNLAAASGMGEALLWNQIGRLALYAGGYGAASCALAVFCFRRREL